MRERSMVIILVAVCFTALARAPIAQRGGPPVQLPDGAARERCAVDVDNHIPGRELGRGIEAVHDPRDLVRALRRHRALTAKQAEREDRHGEVDGHGTGEDEH
jgi:hypothetical protein